MQCAFFSSFTNSILSPSPTKEDLSLSLLSLTLSPFYLSLSLPFLSPPLYASLSFLSISPFLIPPSLSCAFVFDLDNLPAIFLELDDDVCAHNSFVWCLKTPPPPLLRPAHRQKKRLNERSMENSLAIFFQRQLKDVIDGKVGEVLIKRNCLSSRKPPQ